MVEKDVQKGLNLTKEDYAYGILKSILAGIPYAGSSAVEIFSLLCQAPISKRRDEFLILLSKDIIELKEMRKDFSIDDLHENKMFITALMHALPIAMKNHQEEKLKTLRNAVLNSALPNNIEDDMQLIFLVYIDSFTTLHIKLLKFFNEEKSEEWITNLARNVEYNNGINTGKEANASNKRKSYKFMAFFLWKVIVYEFPDANEKGPFYLHVMEDLKSKSLIADINLINSTLTYSLEGNNTPSTPLFGKLFMEFITSPLNDEQ